MKKQVLGAVVAASIVVCGNATAQTYPSRPITMIVPYPAGGAIDALGRILAERMAALLGQPLVIENVSGAGGTVGVGRVARAAADGHTLILGTGDQFVVNGAIYTLQYDLVKDFEPVGLLASSPYLIVTKNAVPAKNLKELIAWLKENRDKVSQGHNGSGGGQHLCGVDLQKNIGAQWQFVPYRGAAPALQDLIGGQIDLMCPLPGSSLAMVRSGRIRAYAVTANSRLAFAPEIPTVDEAGLPGLYDSVWGGLFVPKGTPQDAITKLNSIAVKTLADSAVRERIDSLGMEIPAPEQQTPQALGALQKAEIEKWWPIIKTANIKPE
jgi:tripartite-type tricarboxylate transporter receptor subunit TctC